MSDDAELLRGYAESADEQAFAEFVRRHINLVYSAALRRLAGDAHAAEDVTQQVFLAAARRPAALAGHGELTGWLYAATRNAAFNYMRSEQRRKARELAASIQDALPPDHDTALDWERLRPVLDEAMDALKDPDRQAVLLRFFAGLPLAEIGARLGLSENTARMRVERALDKLHAQLTRRGITSTSVALEAVLTNGAVVAAPAGLAVGVTNAALAGSGVGSLAAAGYFMGASKLTISLVAAGALAAGFTVYQSVKARAIAMELDQTRGKHAALTARIAGLEADVNAAEQAKSGPGLQFEAARIEKAAAASAGKARQLAAEEDRKQQEKALKEFLDNDPELLKLRYDGDIAAVRAWAVWRPGISSPEKLEQVARKNADQAELDKVKERAGLAPEMPKVAQQREPEIIAKEIIPRLFYFMEAPYTLEDASRLQAILGNARIPNIAGNPSIYAKFEWGRILSEAEAFMSPAQMQGLRGLAGRGRNAALRAEVAKQAAELAK